MTTFILYAMILYQSIPVDIMYIKKRKREIIMNKKKTDEKVAKKVVKNKTTAKKATKVVKKEAVKKTAEKKR